jgi:peptide deformylase
MRHVPDPILRQKTRRITQIPANLKQYTDDMVETMHAEHGVGLSANQVGGLQKVAVIQLPEWSEPLVLINPEIIRREGEREVEEGCLSIPGYRGIVKRSQRVRARALDLNGKVIRIKADGLLAQALEHEIDHLNGILYIDHLVSKDAFWKITYESDPPEPADDETSSDSAGDAANPGESTEKAEYLA